MHSKIAKVAIAITAALISIMGCKGAKSRKSTSLINDSCTIRITGISPKQASLMKNSKYETVDMGISPYSYGCLEKLSSSVVQNKFNEAKLEYNAFESIPKPCIRGFNIDSSTLYIARQDSTATILLYFSRRSEPLEEINDTIDVVNQSAVLVNCDDFPIPCKKERI